MLLMYLLNILGWLWSQYPEAPLFLSPVVYDRLHLHEASAFCFDQMVTAYCYD